MVRAEDAEAALVDSVCSRLPRDVGSELVGQSEAFVRYFYRWVPLEDLAGRDAQDLCGAAMSAWQFARDHRPGSASVRAYTPTRDQDGWQALGTIVEVVTDDMPFLVDTVSMEFARRGYAIRLSIVPVIDVLREPNGRLAGVFGPGSGAPGAIAETVMQFEVDRETGPDRLEALVDGIRRVVGDVRAAVEDWPQMRQRVHEIVAGLVSLSPPVARDELAEVGAFLEWVDDGNFIFLGYREYDLVGAVGEEWLRPIEGSGLGILRETSGIASGSFARLSAEVRSRARTADPLILTKANSRSTVHRPEYLDYIGVKRFAQGAVCGERRFLGLYTRAAHEGNPREIPVLRNKVDRVMRRAAFAPNSHHAKALARTLESYPRDELFQITDDQLFEISMGIVALADRQRVRLFVRGDPYRRFVSCLVFVPRDRYNTDNRERIASVLSEVFGATAIDWTVHLSDSKLARLQYTVRTNAEVGECDLAEIERRIARVTRPWTGHLADALRDVHGEERGNALFRRYKEAFPIGYRADWPARAAIPDIDRAEAVAAGQNLVTSVYQSDDVGRSSLRCKLMSAGERITLSDVLPIFENMGLRVSDERPYEIKPDGLGSIWMYDIGLDSPFAVDLTTQAIRSTFQDAFTAVWTGDLENDRLGALVLRAGLTGREVSLLRALVKYLRQVGSTFSDDYLQQALIGNPEVARLLLELFGTRLDPDRHDPDAARRVVIEIEHALDDLGSADQRRILRDCLSIVCATVRTNYFQRTPGAHPKLELALKLDPARMPFLPTPRPRFETFVYSPRLEGVYLRGGRVTRGSIRWSDRREDFRTEALELMAAEMVRNAVIVPLGAKGGFVVKRSSSSTGREPSLDEAATCYRRFLSGLLDVTDNVVCGDVVGPPSVIRDDEDDAYLVVGTEDGSALPPALASSVAAEHGFWLGDSFAAAGPRSTDCEMRVSARGALEAVKRHLRGLGVPTQSAPVTVIGIGGVSEDALGSAMLLSPRIKLIAAFDDQDVFLDPHPDPEASLAARRRLFAARGSTWRDYDPAAISDGGGVFDRSAERISLSAQAREVLDVESEALTPDELVRAVLRASVNVLWSGGTGTFVKARSESHAELSDRANDGARIDAADLRCRVVGEPRWNGITQKGRIEFARAGGSVNTDVVDSAAGVNFSDHEVNLKILLDAAIANGKITTAERTQILAGVAHELGEQVVHASYVQALGVSLERRQAPELLDLHARLIPRFRRRRARERERAEVPSEERVRDLKAAHQGLTSPELAMLANYTKIALKMDLLESDLPEDDYLLGELEHAFPPSLRERFGADMRHHRLRREIIVADLVNSMVDRQGTTFVSRLAEETRADTAHIARSYAIAVAVFEMRGFWREVQALDDVVDERTQAKMLLEGRRLITRAARWLVHNRSAPLDITAAVSTYGPAVATLWQALPDVLSSIDADAWDARVREFGDPNVPITLAARSASLDAGFFAFDIVESISGTAHTVGDAAHIHFTLDRRLELAWLRERILGLPRADIWQTRTRSVLRDELYETHRALTAAVLKATRPSLNADDAIEHWLAANATTVARYLRMLADIRAAPGEHLTTLLVAVRELAKLVRSRNDREATHAEPPR